MYGAASLHSRPADVVQKCTSCVQYKFAVSDESYLQVLLLTLPQAVVRVGALHFQWFWFNRLVFEALEY